MDRHLWYTCRVPGGLRDEGRDEDGARDGHGRIRPEEVGRGQAPGGDEDEGNGVLPQRGASLQRGHPACDGGGREYAREAEPRLQDHRGEADGDDRRAAARGANQPDDQTSPADRRRLHDDGLPNDLLRLVRPEGKIVVGTTSSLPVRQVEGVRRSYEP